LHVLTRPVIGYGEGVIPPDTEVIREEAKEQLDRLAIPGGGVVADRRLAEGDPANVILHIARETHADLIVMGTHGRTGLSRLLMGSVAEQLVRRASSPVLTVTSPFPAAQATLTPEAMGIAGPM